MSSLFGAVDLVLGPQRLSRRPVVDEHDFFAAMYVDPRNIEVIPIQSESRRSAPAKSLSGCLTSQRSHYAVLTGVSNILCRHAAVYSAS